MHRRKFFIFQEFVYFVIFAKTSRQSNIKQPHFTEAYRQVEVKQVEK